MPVEHDRLLSAALRRFSERVGHARGLAVAGASLVLLGCAQVAPAPAPAVKAVTPVVPAPAGPITARGNEPGWTLALADTLRFATDGLVVEGRAPAVQMRESVRVHDGALQGRHVTVEVRARVCGDSMSGMPHPLTVQVRIDDRRFAGCGGRPLDLLLGAEWVVEDIGGTGLIDAARVTLRFSEDGRAGGRGGCNIYTAGFTLTGESLTFSAPAGTLMACAPALEQQERRFHELLARVHRFEIGADGALLLLTPDNRRITARR